MKKLFFTLMIVPLFGFSSKLPTEVECRIYWSEGGNSEAGGGKSYRNSFILQKFDDQDSTYALFYEYGTNRYQLATDLSCQFDGANPSLFSCDQPFSQIKNCVKVTAKGLRRTVLTKNSCSESIPVTIKTREFIQTKSLQSGGCFASFDHN